MPTHHNNNLEYRLFLMACAISIFVTVVLLFIDTFISREFVSSVIELISLAIFTFFYYQARFKGRFEKMVIPFLVAILAIINAAWFTGGGLNLTNALLFYLILLLTVIIAPSNSRSVFLTVIFVNLVIFMSLEFLYPDYSRPVIKNDELLVINSIVMVLTFSIAAFITIFFKKEYDAEREIVNKQNLELDAINSEVETQNEELIQYQEEVMTQRDFIEEKSKMLEMQALELEHANEQVKAVNASLEQIVEKRTRELVSINNDLDLLVYRSSHDFRRPLTTLMGLNEVARLTLIDDFSKELFSKVHSTAVMMDKMLLKFFMLYNINHFRSSYEGHTLDEIIDKIEKNLISRKRNIAFTKKIQLDHYQEKDPRNSLIEIILENLFENSLIYNSKERMEIDLNIFEQEGKLHIHHRDNGNGIPLSYQSKVFEMYFRGSTLSTGNGLGLFVVKRAADLLKATIDLQSKEVEFTRFEIAFKI
jgi:signal transduction histidine kinase